MKYCNTHTYQPIASVNIVLPTIEELSTDDIISIVCTYYGVYRHEIMSKSNQRKVVYPRQQAMTLMREFLKEITLKKIGQLFDKDHSTVIHSIGNVNDLCDVDKKYRANYIKLRAKILTLGTKANAA